MRKNCESAGISEFGRRCGETHHQARLTDHDVELIRELREEHKIPLGVLAEKFEVSVSLISMICNYQRRTARPVAWRQTVLRESSAGAKNNTSGTLPETDEED